MKIHCINGCGTLIETETSNLIGVGLENIPKKRMCDPCVKEVKEALNSIESKNT